MISVFTIIIILIIFDSRKLEGVIIEQDNIWLYNIDNLISNSASFA